jgi:tripeptidyl-peptidase-1
LDIEYLMGVAPNVPAWYWSNPSFDFYTDLTDWVSQIEATSNGPWVHSVSYGDQSEGPSDDYQDRLDAEFQKISSTGVSIIFASGDSGTGCGSCAKFFPAYPSTSIFVTGVGATEFIGNSVGPEQATVSFGSGGGFSWHFSRPSYQNAAVNNYLSTMSAKLPPSHFYNSAGRATPDVAALGIGYQVVVNGRTSSVGGTSASAPTFAAIISLLNDRRLNQGKPTLGFLNNWIYQTAAAHPDAFYDVTVGNNHNGCCGDGFLCAKGWDPITGVGTPNYVALINYLP